MKRILFADDNKSIREFCKCQLEEAGYRVLLARDGREAALLVEGDQIDLAILDINMPIMDGYEAANRIRQRAPSLPILFFTAHDANDATAAAGAATVARIKKSDDLSELKRAIAQLLESG